MKRATERAGLPERVKLPSAEQLAQIAAGLGSQTSPADAVKKAVSLFLHAVEFKANHDNMSAQAVAQACDPELASRWRCDAMKAPFRQECLLDPGKRNDDARRVLAKRGLNLRKPKSLLENLRMLYRLDHIRRFIADKKIQVTGEGGKSLRLLGDPSPEGEKASCQAVTQRELDQRTEEIAKQQGWREDDAQLAWKQELERITEYRAGARKVYRVPSSWLGTLLEWKKELKRTGGAKSRQAKKPPNIA